MVEKPLGDCRYDYEYSEEMVLTGPITPVVCWPRQKDLEERDAIEQKVADGELCSVDGEPHDWEECRELYGEDRDGNRGVWQHFKQCRKCGDER